MKLPGHKTKIVCTIGPASRSTSVLKRLIGNGMNVARLNLAHGNLDDHREDIRRIRSISAKLNRPVSILLELPGPKIRIGKLQNEPLILKKGSNITLTTRDVPGKASLLPIEYAEFPRSVSIGSIVYLNDGFVQLRVQEISGDEVGCKVVIGGQLLSHKGLNLPGAKIALDPVTASDLDLLAFGLEEGVDIFGMSFVEKADDILRVKEFARGRDRSIRVVAKIERAEAIKNINEILGAADAIMIARGDLGVQIPIQDVPVVQKKLIRKANLLGLPVITATQMLESMTENVRPTRAEATDVANAILDGTDAVMLSEETAIGKYPVETVRMMAAIAASTERHRRSMKTRSNIEERFRDVPTSKHTTVEDVISLNVTEALRTLDVRLILTPTYTGSTPRRISRFKPNCWILTFSSREPIYRFLTLSYGVYPILTRDAEDRWHDAMLEFVRNSGLARKGDTLILTEGAHCGEFSGTDSLRIIRMA